MSTETPAPDDQREVIAFLSDPRTHGVAGPVQTITTHSAHVFLAGARAYKIKRAVRYNYLDFSTLAARRAVLERELDLNRPAAPMIYERVLPVTRGADGALGLGGAGPAVEYVLVMNRFDREAELTRIAETGALTRDIAEQLGAAVAALHARAPRREADGAVLIAEILDELREALGGMGATLNGGRLERWFAAADRVYAGTAPLLARRSAEGRVRLCHGDLHLKNLVLIEGQVVPFDALEFDERLGTCDVFYDFAFLVMDLLHRRLFAAANAVMNSYLDATRDHAGLAALPLFLGVRAAIRSMVAVQTASGTVPGANAADARAYLDDALASLAPPPPRLLAVGGLSGTGKTTVARCLAPQIGPAPGAVHLRSDVVRKAMFGVAPQDRLPEAAYAPEAGARVYRRLAETAATVLAAGHAAVLDATFLDARASAAAEEIARRHGTEFTGLWLTADPATLQARVAGRRGDASDADLQVLRKQLARDAPPPPGWIVVEAAGTPEEVAARAASALS